MPKIIEIMEHSKQKLTVACVHLLHGPLSFFIFLNGVGIKAMGYTLSNYKTLVKATNCTNHDWRNIGRRLNDGGYTIFEINNMHRDAFWLTAVCSVIVVGYCAASGYLVDVSATHRDDFPRWRIHLGRGGAFAITLLSFHVASHLETLVSDCLVHGGHRKLSDSHSTTSVDSATSTDDHADVYYSHKPRDRHGYGFTQALFLSNVFAIASLLVAYVAVDPYRNCTLEDFEETHTHVSIRTIHTETTSDKDVELAETRDDAKRL